MEKYSWYQDILKDHYYHPRNKGEIDVPHFFYMLKNPSCGDSISFAGIIENERIEMIRFVGTGCVLSQATASLLTERVIGLTIPEIQEITPADMQELVGIPVGPVRLKCVTLSLIAVQKGIEKYAQSHTTDTSM